MSESGVAEGTGCAGTGVKESSGLGKLDCVEDETCGAIAAVNAAEVPIFRALRRVIFSVIGLGKPYSSGSSQPPAFLWRGKAPPPLKRRHSNGREQNRAFRRPCRRLFPALL